MAVETYTMTLQLKERGRSKTLLLPSNFCDSHNIHKGDWFEVSITKINGS